MNRMKKIIAILLVIALCNSISMGITAEAKENNVTCKSLCGVALKATGGSEKLKYTSNMAIDFGGLSASARNKVKEISYVCDAKEVYSLCVMRTGRSKDTKTVVKALQKYKKNNTHSDYLSDYSSDEKKVFQNAICGKQGCYVWYIAMSPKKSQNTKGQKALKKKI